VFNIGGPEVLVILFLALVVLGPQRLPDAARQIGKFMGELRRMSNGFQQELKQAFDEPTEAAARQRGAAAVQPEKLDAPAVAPVPAAAPVVPAQPEPAPSATKATPRKRSAPLRAAPRKPAR
jgi:Tat protein translocase TatB subunit